MSKILDFKLSHRPKCKKCGHYLDEHMISFDDTYNCTGFICQRVMEIKDGKVYYICGCIK